MQFIQTYGKGAIYKNRGTYFLKMPMGIYTGPTIQSCLTLMDETARLKAAKKAKKPVSSDESS